MQVTLLVIFHNAAFTVWSFSELIINHILFCNKFRTTLIILLDLLLYGSVKSICSRGLGFRDRVKV